MLWMLLKPEKLNKSEREMIDRLTALSPEISKALELIIDFHCFMKEKKVDCLGKWIVDAKNSNIDELKSFARRLEEDRSEIEAAITHKWSNGQVEGQVNRLKMIKRTMYGRAKIDLLRARVLNRI